MALNVVFTSQRTAEQLRAALSSVRIASVRLHDSLSELPPAATAAVMSALTGSASAVTALHGIPLRGRQRLGLTAFTQLRALTLRRRDPPDPRDPRHILRATELPSSVRDLTLDSGQFDVRDLASFAGLEKLHNLRRITLRGYSSSWHMVTWEDEQRRPLQLPPSLAVRARWSMAVLHDSRLGRRWPAEVLAQHVMLLVRCSWSPSSIYISAWQVYCARVHAQAPVQRTGRDLNTAHVDADSAHRGLARRLGLHHHRRTQEEIGYQYCIP